MISETDYITALQQYKDDKEFADLIDEICKLRNYYNTQQYDAMQSHINALTIKYFAETQLWNSTHPEMPITPQQSYLNAEAFLKSKGASLLMEKGLN